MPARAFIPQTIVDSAVSASTVASAASTSNQHRLETLRLLPAAGVAARTERGDASLSGVVGAQDATAEAYVGSDGLLVDAGWRTALGQVQAGAGSITGEPATLVPFRADCDSIDDCSAASLIPASKLAHELSTVNQTLQEELLQTTAAVLAQKDSSIAAPLATSTALLLSRLFGEAAKHLGGPIAGFLASTVVAAAQSAVAAQLELFLGRPPTQTDTVDVVRQFFGAYGTGLRNTVWEFRDDCQAQGPEALRGYIEAAQALLADPEGTRDIFRAGALMALGTYAGQRTTTFDMQGVAHGPFLFQLAFEWDGKGEPVPRSVAVPAALGKGNTALSTQGFLAVQTVQFTDTQRWIVGTWSESGDTRVAHVDPTRRTELAEKGCGDPSHVRALRLAASRGDPAAEEELDRLVIMGVSALAKALRESLTYRSAQDAGLDILGASS